MVSNSIWMDSGAMVSMIPEMDLYLGDFVSISQANNQATITLDATFTNKFELVTNLYVGCYLRIHLASNNNLVDRVMIQANAGGTITVNDTLDTDITDTPSNYYGIIEHFGAPVPGVKVGSGSDSFTDQVLTVTFKSDDSSDYDDFAIVFGTIDADGSSGTQTTRVLTMSEGAAYGGSLTSTSNVDISGADLNTAEEIVAHIVANASITDAVLTRSGANLIITNDYGHTMTYTPGLDDGTGADTDNLSAPSTSIISLAVTTVGATVSTGGNPTLLADTWLGLTDSVSIPSTSIETKGIPISTGSRSMVYQFKGIETTSGGNFSVTANNFSWLYYALGNKEITTVNGEGDVTMDGSDGEFLSTGESNTNFVYSTDANTIGFNRLDGNTVCPPLNPQLGQTTSTIKKIDTSDLTNKIVYTFSESNNEDLPTFALEYTLKKPDDILTVGVDSSKESVYTKIYPGCMVSSLTLDASANQEVKMNVNFETKKTFVAPTNYQTANEQTDVKDFVNFGSPQGGDANVDEELLRPFFFSDGTISMFGQDYIRIETMSLEINNSLTPKRFVGKYDKTSQFHFPAQRTYNLSFSGLVTDAAVFDALRRTDAYSLSGTTGNELTLRFTKDLSTDEVLEMKFEDYMVTTAEFPLTNDKGPITVNWTIVPLRLKSCSHTTNWIIQG